jgi:acetoin utilization deacetylase AcuC-like enzyme
MSTGYVWHELYGWHDTGTHGGFIPASAKTQPHHHFESAESKTRFNSLVEVSGLSKHLVRIEATPATDEDILRVHTPEHLASIKEQSENIRGGDAGDGTTPFGHQGFVIAALAAGGSMAALEAVLDGRVKNAYALVRPPGHHARPEIGMGFCMFGNAAIAIKKAQAANPDLRVATVDWDVHHGNGTQAIFYDDPSVLTISLHQNDLYPRGTGAVSERGEGAGDGYCINIPLPAGTGNGGYQYAMTEVVIPALRRFQPDVIVVPSGFDASIFDPLARMSVTASGYRIMTRMLMDAAEELCGGRLMMTHEGGYSASYVPVCGVEVLSEMSGVPVDVIHEFHADFDTMPEHELTPWQVEAVKAVLAEHSL